MIRPITARPLIEYQVKCMRMDRVRIPFIGHITGLFKERWAYLPKFHLATARVGTGPNAVVAERWQYVGESLHAAYDTRQIFRTDYPHGPFTVLPPWDYQPPPKPFEKFKARLARLWDAGQRLPVVRREKSDLIKWVQRLPAERRINFMKTHGLG